MRTTISFYFIINLLTTCFFTNQVFSAVFTVINTADAGAGSLRQAILDAGVAGADTIIFDISGIAPHYIFPASTLNIPASTCIDGSTQPLNGFAGVGPKIVIDGQGTSMNGLLISGNNCSVYGLHIRSFTGFSAGRGIYLFSSSNTIIGGSSPGQGNVISRCRIGVHVTVNSAGTIFKGNLIGTDSSGTFAMGNTREGIYLQNSTINTIIGGNNPGERNVISGNGKGIYVQNNGSGNIIKGNYIGTDITGTLPMGNIWEGIYLQNSTNNTIIGGGSPGDRNIISNNRIGIKIQNSCIGNIIKGNYIGTDITGTLPMGNTREGIFLQNATINTVVGGSNPGDKNVISGNGIGIYVQNDCTENTIKGNYIGTDVTGTFAVENGIGIQLAASSDSNLIGGSNLGDGNLISGNTSNGILITEVNFGIFSIVSNTAIIGNKIGTDVSGMVALGNGQNGIECRGINSMIGPDNIIAFNGKHGIEINLAETLYNQISNNSIFNNTQKGIALTNGGNKNYPFPIILSVTPGSVTGRSQANDTIEVFYNHTGNVNPQGETYIGTTVADGGGNWTYTGSISGTICNITATATSDSNNTSEFVPSSFVQILPNDTVICIGDSITLTAVTLLPTGNYGWLNASVPTDTLSFDSILRVSPTSITTFTIVSINGQLCQGDSVEIDVLPQPVVNLGNDSTMCDNNYLLDAGNPNSSYLWSTGDTSETITVATTDTFWVVVNSICASDTDSVIITIGNSPIVSLGTDTVICKGNTVMLDAGNIEAVHQWSTGDTTQTILVSQSGNYSIIITVNNICVSFDTIVIMLEDCDTLKTYFFIPNVFSPNGDGDNDVFRIRGEGIKDLVIQIYDRWGNRVFESKNINKTWKGLESNKGVYVYVITGEFLDGNKIDLKGNVILIK